jgi:hypothetical protein
MPFDWAALTIPGNLKHAIEDDLRNYIPDVKNGVFMNSYNIKLPHFNPQLDLGINEHHRRIDRFKGLLSGPAHLFFVYTNEPYLIHKGYREGPSIERCHKDMVDLDDLLASKYPALAYNILYIDFVDHPRLDDSRIIPITVSSSRLYDSTVDLSLGVVIGDHRLFLGKMLAEVFGTNFCAEFRIDSFYDDFFN